MYRQDILSQKYSLFLFSKTSLSWNKHLHTSKSAFTLRQVTILIYFYNESHVTSTCGLYFSEHIAFEIFLKISILFQTCLCIILPLTNSSLLYVSKSLMVHCIPKSFSLFRVHNDTTDPSEAIPWKKITVFPVPLTSALTAVFSSPGDTVLVPSGMWKSNFPR